MPWSAFPAWRQPKHVMPPGWYTTRDIREALRVHKLTVWRWIKSGQLKPVRVGGRWRISQAELDRFLGTRTTLPTSDS